LDTVALLQSRQNESGDFDALPVTPRASGDDWDMKHRAALLLHQPSMRFDFALGLQPVIQFVPDLRPRHSKIWKARRRMNSGTLSGGELVFGP